MMAPGYLSDVQIEDMAARLLGRYQSRYGVLTGPPVPVERIVEDVLDLNILWDEIPETQGQSILAALEPHSRMVVFNESRKGLLEETQGLYNTVLAHEAGHWEVHVDQSLLAQQSFPQLGRNYGCLFRNSGPGQDTREVQAHKFMNYLLMPHDLTLNAIRGLDLLNWPTLYQLRDAFGVTITALKIRLERLGLLFVANDGQLYFSRQEYEGQGHLAY